jgi:glycosyltransferase involved in cell wall biosynthesis
MTPDFTFSGHLSHAPHRVLMTADTIGGVWTYAFELARVLCEQDIEIALATMGAPLTSAQWRETERIPNLGIFESTSKLEWMHEPWDDVRAAGEWLMELERSLRPDVVHLNNFAHGALPFSAPKLVVAHSDVLSWWRAVKGEDAPESWKQYRDVVRTGLRAADLVVAPSTCALTDVIHHYGPLRKTEVVPNGREISFRHVAKEPFIFSSGRLWDEAKNISTLAGIAGDLAWPVHVAGDTDEPGKRNAGGKFSDCSATGLTESRAVSPHPGPLPPGEGDAAPSVGFEPNASVAERTEEHFSLSPRERAGVRGKGTQIDCSASASDQGLSGPFLNVRLLGRLNASQMAEQFERASIFCLPVRYEPFGLSALEAALAGCVLVLGDIPSQREIWRDAAVFVPPNDADALRTALQQLIADASRRRELAERAHDRALEFTTLRMASSYLALYSELMEQPRHARVCAS